jgi:RimJ/RimL family protein N-acetyltransferase
MPTTTDAGGFVYPPLPGGLRTPLPTNLLRASRRTAQGIVTLRDGGRVLLRPLRPSDRDLYLRGFEHLSATSRYMRFFSPKPRLSEAELHYFLDVDHHDHEALVAIDLATGEGIGVARYVREREPDRAAIAEVSVTVVDEHQGRGLGAALLEALARRAAGEGVARFRAMVLSDNHRMLNLIGTRWPQHQVRRRDASVLELEFALRR